MVNKQILNEEVMQSVNHEIDCMIPNHSTEIYGKNKNALKNYLSPE
jgi:hypothetical protein